MTNIKQYALAFTCAFFFDIFGTTLASHTVHVKSPASIQTALSQAKSGDIIIVEAGTYSEQISITTNGITLQGKNAIINPPSVPLKNPCTDLAGPGTQAGICIAGSGITYINQPFNGEHKKVQSVTTPVKNVKVSGFTINGFSGLNIAVLGTVDANVENNTVSSGPQYGILTVGSKNSDIRRNTVLPGGFIGICMDDQSTVEIARNDISGCIGAFVDPNISSAQLHDNTFKNTGTACNPALGIAGVLISGGKNTGLRSNTFSGIGLDGQGAGLVIVDDPSGAVATGNDARRNTFRGNNLDVFVSSEGAGNVVKSNKCSSSVPAVLCLGS